MTASQRIPTLPDVLIEVTARMANRATSHAIDPILEEEIDRILQIAPVTLDDLFMRIALARGCHAVAEERRLRNDPGQATCFHYFGQILMEEAVKLT